MVDHAKCDDEPAFSYKQWTWLEISWLQFSGCGISHLQQQNSSHISAIYVPHSTLFSTLQLYGKHSTLYLFDPHTQNTLYIICNYIMYQFCTP